MVGHTYGLPVGTAVRIKRYDAVIAYYAGWQGVVAGIEPGEIVEGRRGEPVYRVRFDRDEGVQHIHFYRRDLARLRADEPRGRAQ